MLSAEEDRNEAGVGSGRWGGKDSPRGKQARPPGSSPGLLQALSGESSILGAVSSPLSGLLYPVLQFLRQYG